MKVLHFIFDEVSLQHIKRDWNRRFLKYADKSKIWKTRYYFSQPQYKTLFFFRLYAACRSKILKKILGRVYTRLSRKSGLEITMQNIAGGIIMPHWGRIILNAKSIGQDLYVLHNVTIGDDYVSGRPRIGNNVFVGTGAIIMGNISIGDNVVIGAGSLVNADIPSHSLAIGNPAKVIRTIDGDFIKNLIGYSLD